MMKEGEGGGTREETRRISLSLFHDNLPFVRVSLNEKSVESARIRLKHAWKGFPRELHAEHPHEKCTRWPRRPFRKKNRLFLSPFLSFFLSFFLSISHLPLLLFSISCSFNIFTFYINRTRMKILYKRYKKSTKCRACQSAVCRALAVCKLSLMHVVLSVLACRDSVL